MSEEKAKKGVQVTIPENVKGGVYCNLMAVSHTGEEFMMDFIMTHPAGAVVTARIIMSPGHMKRTIATLADNFGKYEKEHKLVSPAPEPEIERSGIGFVKGK